MTFFTLKNELKVKLKKLTNFENLKVLLLSHIRFLKFFRFVYKKNLFIIIF